MSASESVDVELPISGGATFRRLPRYSHKALNGTEMACPDPDEYPPPMRAQCQVSKPTGALYVARGQL